jgi:hypothetical protein
MPDEIRGDDPRTIWQNQSMESFAMPLEEIRQRARELHAKTRKKLLGTLAGPIAVALFYGFSLKEFPALRQTLNPLLGFALAWSLIGLYFLNRRMWSAVMPGDAGFTTGMEFCRREIERQRDILRRVLLWSFGPVLLAIGTFILALAMIGSRAGGIFPNAFPFLILVVVWILAYFVIRFREQSQLQHELDELNEIGRQNSR